MFCRKIYLCPSGRCHIRRPRLYSLSNLPLLWFDWNAFQLGLCVLWLKRWLLSSWSKTLWRCLGELRKRWCCTGWWCCHLRLCKCCSRCSRRHRIEARFTSVEIPFGLMLGPRTSHTLLGVRMRVYFSDTRWFCHLGVKSHTFCNHSWGWSSLMEWRICSQLDPIGERRAIYLDNARSHRCIRVWSGPKDLEGLHRTYWLLVEII